MTLPSLSRLTYACTDHQKHTGHLDRQNTMKRNNARSIPKELKPTSVQQFGVNQLALFDFTARDDARDISDVNILVGFDGRVISTRYFGVQFYLEDQPDCPVESGH